MKKLFITLFLILTQFIQSQVGIGTDNPDPSSILEVESTSKGILIPRITKEQRDLINNPSPGLIIYQIDDNPGIYLFQSRWKAVYLSSSDSESNITLGHNSLKMSTSQFHNIAIGTNSGYNLESDNNILIGNHSGYYITSGKENIAIGSNSLQNNHIGSFNTVLGGGSGERILDGSSNTLLGHQTGQNLISGNRNTLIGNYANIYSDNRDENPSQVSNSTAIGSRAVVKTSNTIQLGDLNIELVSTEGKVKASSFEGDGSLLSNIKVSDYETIHSQLLMDIEELSSLNNSLETQIASLSNLISATNQSTSQQIAAFQSQTSSFASSLAVISSSLDAVYANNASISSEISNLTNQMESLQSDINELQTITLDNLENISIGSKLDNNTTGSSNIALGLNSLGSNTEGTSNISIGSKSMLNNTTGWSNIAIGQGSLENNITGDRNVAIGTISLFNNTTGQYNTSIGDESMHQNTTGTSNSSLGLKSLRTNTTGNNNVSIGMYSGQYNQIGSNNTFLGTESQNDEYLNEVNNSTSIGFESKIEISNAMSFGNGSVSKWVFGRTNTSDNGYAFQVGTTTSNGNGAYLTNGGTWTNASSKNFKENFTPINGEEILEKLLILNLMKWNYKGTTETHIGPISEQFKELFGLGVEGDDEHISTIDVSGVALKAVQTLIELNNQLSQDINELKNRISELENK